ncbi:MAG: CvpA family protein [Rhodobacteraceae bacterium]|nr:CvpA family protein [Paracoccaceae bacterium]
MESQIIFDGIVAIVIVVSAILAYARGFIREAMAILSWVMAAWISFVLAAWLRPLVEEIRIPAIGPFPGGRIFADNCEIATVVAFALIFALSVVILSIFASLLSSLIHKSALGIFDHGFGLVFGALRGVVLIAVLIFLYRTIGAGQAIAAIDNSHSAVVFDQINLAVPDDVVQQILAWIIGHSETLVGDCGGDPLPNLQELAPAQSPLDEGPGTLVDPLVNP